MKNSNSINTTSVESNSQISGLETIHRLINARTFQPELIEEKLFKINPSTLRPSGLVYFLYLNVRHHFNYYKAENSIEHLELASGLIDKMDATARKK